MKELFDVYGDISLTQQSYNKRMADDEKSLQYRYKVQNLYDSFTKNKKYVQKYYKYGLGKLKYNSRQEFKEDGTHSKFIVQCVTTINNYKIITLGVGEAFLKKDAKQISAKNTLQKLEEMGIKKEIPQIFKN